MSGKKRRSSAPNTAGVSKHASFNIKGAWRTAAKVCAEDAQKKIDERHAKREASRWTKYTSKNEAKTVAYPPEIVAEAMAMVEAGWSKRTVSKVMDIPYYTILNWASGATRQFSAAQAKNIRK